MDHTIILLLARYETLLLPSLLHRVYCNYQLRCLGKTGNTQPPRSPGHPGVGWDQEAAMRNLAGLFVLRTWTTSTTSLRPYPGQTMSTANRTLLTTSEAGFGSFVYFCRDVPSYTWCNFFYGQVTSIYPMISHRMLSKSVIILISCPRPAVCAWQIQVSRRLESKSNVGHRWPAAIIRVM